MVLVSFRINTGNFLLEVQVEGRPGWLLACHERWNLSLGTLICRQLGYLQLARHKGVNLTDVKVNDTQELVQIVPNQKSSIEDVWQEQLCFRANCGSEVLRVRPALQGSPDRGGKRRPVGTLAVAGQPVPQLQTRVRRLRGGARLDRHGRSLCAQLQASIGLQLAGLCRDYRPRVSPTAGPCGGGENHLPPPL
ncbi:transmembrane protease serine 5-like isoform X1 [Mauremys mutica]|uniref:transmembrane protease serine 5-like isoform X1 n=1 Tax=Mauremys mutica TaxID=74926 RepID=UPI001D164B5F|nr:transmembrane protease serine 5-like isoform X1 [Mauremys mutica]